jgi:hypothetical protein
MTKNSIGRFFCAYRRSEFSLTRQVLNRDLTGLLTGSDRSRMKDFDNHACRLLAELFADLGGKRRKIETQTAYPVHSIA